MEGHRQEKERKFPKKVIKGKKAGIFCSIVKKVRIDERKMPYIGIVGMKRGMDRMYRGKIAGKDVIVRLGNRVSRRYFSDNKIYNMVLSYGETAFRKGQETFCIYNDRIGFIVAEVERNDIPVIRIDYIIENENVYE
jgi:hypothetical protein